MDYSLNSLIEYWNKVFESEEPMKMILSLEGSEKLRKVIRKKFDLRYYPEPFYGYINQEMTNDILFLLLNPGQERVEELNGRFPSNSLEESRDLWNKSTKDRHLNWRAEDYRSEERNIYVSEKWRNERLVAALDILNQYNGQYVSPEECFLHTVEFFPFRSKNFTVKNNWIFELNSTKHMLGALKDITEANKVKHIFAVSQSWFDILEHENGIFKPERKMRVTLKKKDSDPSGHHFSHRMAIYRQNEKATPILVYKAGGSSRMNLPVNQTAKKIIRYMLGVEGGELPKADEKFNIIID